MGLSFTIAVGPRQRSHSQVRVPLNSWQYFTVSDSWLPEPGGLGPRIYIPQETDIWARYLRNKTLDLYQYMTLIAEICTCIRAQADNLKDSKYILWKRISYKCFLRNPFITFLAVRGLSHAFVEKFCPHSQPTNEATREPFKEMYSHYFFVTPADNDAIAYICALNMFIPQVYTKLALHGHVCCQENSKTVNMYSHGAPRNKCGHFSLEEFRRDFIF
jgi:hypothetical protein